MHSLKILIVEDEVNLARTLAQALRLGSEGGYEVEVVGSAEQAYGFLSLAHYDLVISDLNLPGENGLSLITKVKETAPHIQTILITGYGSKEVEERVDRLSEGYLTKPFDMLDLIHMVQRVVSQPMRKDGLALKRQDLENEKQRRILIMEDDRGLRQIYTKALRKSRYQVDGAATIQAARKLLQEHVYAIFVCDIYLGRERGTDLLEEFRYQFERHGTQVVMCSEYGHYRYLSEELGFEYFLEKPISLGTLLALIHRLTETAPT